MMGAHILGSVILKIAIFSGYVLQRYSMMQSLSQTTTSPCLSTGNCVQQASRAFRQQF
jgi:hypothetical protein